MVRASGVEALARELANNCVLKHLDEASCELALHPKHSHIRSASTEAHLEKALQNYFRRPLKLTIRLDSVCSKRVLLPNEP